MISLGTYQLFGDACGEAVKLALALGYRSIDTAIGYQNEDAVGKAISESGVPRSQIRIQTKIPPDVIKLEEVGVEAAVKKSMEKLGVEYIDSVLLHWPGAAKIKAESQDHILFRVKAWKTLEKLKSEGKVREIGVSNFLPRHLDSIVSNSSCGGVIDVIQMELHPLCRQQDVLDWIASSNKKKEQHQHQKTNATRIEAYGLFGGGKVIEQLRSALNTRERKEEDEEAEAEKEVATSAADVSEMLLEWCVKQNLIPVVRSTSKSHLENNFTVVQRVAKEMKERQNEKHESASSQRLLLAEARIRQQREEGEKEKDTHFYWYSEKLA